MRIELKDRIGSERQGAAFSFIRAHEQESADACAEESAELLKKVHGTRVLESGLADMRESALSWASSLREILPEKAGEKLLRLYQAMPHDDRMIRDYRGALDRKDGGLLRIDTDTPAVGNPIFELASMYNALVGSYEPDHGQSAGYDSETARSFWRKSLAAYLGTGCEHKLLEVENKARIIGYTRLIRDAIRRGRQSCEEGRREIETWQRELLRLLDRTDTLLFRTDEIELEAMRDYTEEVQAFVEERLASCACTPKTLMQIAVSVEEIYVNIANYAYKPNTGMAWIRADVSGDPACLTLVFRDRGIPYNPLAREDPDVTPAAEDRKIGGLGIYMTKVFMDEESYVYENGQNILTLKKKR